MPIRPVDNDIVKQIWPFATTMNRLLGKQCRAKLERKDAKHRYWGRCELIDDHFCNHVLERGNVIVQFTTTVISY